MENKCPKCRYRILFKEVPKVSLERVQSLELRESERGTQGFGSTETRNK